jgi:hypothetical protein
VCEEQVHLTRPSPLSSLLVFYSLFISTYYSWMGQQVSKSVWWLCWVVGLIVCHIPIHILFTAGTDFGMAAHLFLDNVFI